MVAGPAGADTLARVTTPSPFWTTLLLSCAAALSACGGSDADGALASGAAGAAGTSGGGSAGAAGAGGDATAGSSAAGSSAAGMAGASGAPSGPAPDAKFLPSPKGACPELVKGKITVSPGGKPRDVQLWISDAAKSLDGPLVFYWHGTGSSPVFEPPYGLGNSQIAEIEAQGGIVAAPYHDPAAGTFPWFLIDGSGPDDDLVVADEILACAIQKVGIDVRRIHSVGMSAGGLQTAQLSWRRSGYVASSVVYSGGQYLQPPNQDPSNKFPSMIFWGGKTDCYGQYCFDAPTNAYKKALTDAGHFAFICDHGGGHTIPQKDVGATWKFLSAHPYGTNPSPYAAGLPTGFPSGCAL